MYIGIIIEVGHKKYLAPLTSPGKEYLVKSKKHRRIVHPIKNGEYGFVRVGNMIPVNEKVVKPVIIAEIEDEFYRNILIERNLYLRKDYVIDEIRNQAHNLYSKRYNKDNYFLSDILCNYKLLESMCSEWELTH